jgi:hypothetical protein
VNDSDLTLEILRGIRAATERTNVQLEQTNARLDQLQQETNARLDKLTARVDTGFADNERSLTNFGMQLLVLIRQLRQHTEIDFEELKVRVAKLELKLG